MMRYSRYSGTPNIGVFTAVNESFAFIAGDATPEFVKDVEEALQVETHLMTVAGSFVIGSLVVMNSNGAVVSGLADPREIEIIEKCLPCTPIDDALNAAGNNILANDSGAIVNPEYSDDMVRIISDALGVECVRSSIAGINTVGSVCRATNKGCVCHADSSDEDMDLIMDVLKVEAIRSTVNHGARMVGAGILANSKGALIGDDTTPIEMGKIEEGLALY
jgi:translation initiation factor 6